MNKLFIFILTIAFALPVTSVYSDSLKKQSAQLSIELKLPELDVSPYHKPYVAIWLETPTRKYVTTIALWANDLEWHKDLRQWWRKVGAVDVNIDGVTGATRRAGQYTVIWHGKDENNQTVLPGEYLLNIEVVREEGGRDFLRKKIHLGQAQQFLLNDKIEINNTSITSYQINKD